MTPAPGDTVLRDYLDALLQDAAPAASKATQGDPAPTWLACRMGRLQLLLPSASIGAPIATLDFETPESWHRARIRIGKDDWQVAELGACIAPGFAVLPIDTLLPVTGSGWLLGVTGQPVRLSLDDDAIEWRTQRSSRPWLCGMSRDGRYMTLDVQALIAHAAGIGQQGSPA